MFIDKVNWITADNYGKPKVAFFHVSFKLKREIWGLDMASQNVP